MAELTAHEQLLLELVNRARLDPTGEAARYGITLDQGLSPGTLAGGSRDPLAPNDLLNDAALGHSSWMLANDVFSHTGAGGSTPSQRMTAAGYVLSGSWTTGENIAWVGTTGSVDLEEFTLAIHRNLFLSPGHRTNMLAEGFREVGIGIDTGVFTDGGDWNAVMATENFARSGSSYFLTGVIYDDADGDAFYDIGEGQGGVGVAAPGTAGDTTGAAGGYAVAFAGGTVDVTFSGGGLAGPVVVTVVAGAHNAKVDYIGEGEILSSVSATLGSGAEHLTLLGTRDIDGTGNAAANTLDGTSGANTLAGLGGADTLLGWAGNDRLEGGTGGDLLRGGAGTDRLLGGADADVFDFNAVSETRRGGARDSIGDFARGLDDIDLSGIDARSGGADNAFRWIGRQDFHGRDGELHYVKKAGYVLVEGDVDGDGRADFQIKVDGLGAIAKGDFIL